MVMNTHHLVTCFYLPFCTGHNPSQQPSSGIPSLLPFLPPRHVPLFVILLPPTATHYSIPPPPQLSFLPSSFIFILFPLPNTDLKLYSLLPPIIFPISYLCHLISYLSPPHDSLSFLLLPFPTSSLLSQVFSFLFHPLFRHRCLL